jgi:hypothetical protein
MGLIAYVVDIMKTIYLQKYHTKKINNYVKLLCKLRDCEVVKDKLNTQTNRKRLGKYQNMN